MYVILDFHVANKTPARTTWLVYYKNQLLKLRDAEMRGLIKFVKYLQYGRTHYKSLYHILNSEVALIRKRVSNRGNVSYLQFNYPYEPLALKGMDLEVVLNE